MPPLSDFLRPTTTAMNKKYVKNFILLGILSLILISARIYLVNCDPENQEQLIFYMAAHLLSFAALVTLINIWGINCYLRIIHTQIRRCNLFIAVCMLLLMLLHILRRTAADGLGDISRYIWYLYYVPMILIPNFSFTASLYLGHEKDYQPDRRWYLFLLPGLLFLLFILTNDYHNLAFFIPEDWDVTYNYQHRVIYYLSAIWIFLTIFLTLQKIYRISKPLLKEHILPIPYIISLLSVLYCILYIFCPPVSDYLNPAPIFCLFTMGMISALIYHGLIPTNQDFDWCFHASGMDIQILDSSGELQYISAAALPVTKEYLHTLQEAGGHLSTTSKEYHLQKIHGGYVVSSHDIQAIQEIMQKTEKTNAILEKTNHQLTPLYSAQSKCSGCRLQLKVLQSPNQKNEKRRYPFYDNLSSSFPIHAGSCVRTCSYCAGMPAGIGMRPVLFSKMVLYPVNSGNRDSALHDYPCDCYTARNV